MRTRIITAVIATAIGLIVLVVLPPLATFIAMSLLSGMAVYEMTGAMKLRDFPEIPAFCVSMALLVPFFPAVPFRFVGAALLLYGLLLTCVMLRRHEQLTVVLTVSMGFLTLLIACGLSAVAYLRRYDHGLPMLFLSLLIPWLSDSGAYFTGVFFGRHKLCSKISPKKTVEGFIGGIVISTVLCTLIAWIYAQVAHVDVILWRVAVLTLIGAPISVMGDLFASLIKRQHDVKDYGWILPGHGGIMDRFDSVIFVAPFMVLWIQWLPLVR